MIEKNREQQLRQAIELFFFSYRAFTHGPDEILARRGLGRVHHRILYFVGQQPELAVNELLQILQISKQALNPPLRQLLSMKLVKNEQSKADRRIRELSLTASGKRLEARLTDTQLIQLENVFKDQGKKAERAWKLIMQQLSDE